MTESLVRCGSVNPRPGARDTSAQARPRSVAAPPAQADNDELTALAYASGLFPFARCSCCIYAAQSSTGDDGKVHPRLPAPVAANATNPGR